jgi:hypothetical protein
MIGKLLKTIFKSGQKATESVGKSMDFIDDLLEKEVIVGAVESIKEGTGKVVEKAGSLYQNSIDLLEDKKAELSESMIETSDTIKNVMKEGESIVKKVIGDSEEE